MSNINWYKYDWVWKKSKKLGFTNAKNKPLNDHECISVFTEGTCANRSANRMMYNPQGLLPYGKLVKGEKRSVDDLEGHRFSRPNHKKEYIQQYTNYPSQIIEFASEGKPIHPTQKPVPLLEYIIKTYTNEEFVVMDNCMGVGSTGVACLNTNRKFIGIEKDEKYFNMAIDRIQKRNEELYHYEERYNQ